MPGRVEDVSLCHWVQTGSGIPRTNSWLLATISTVKAEAACTWILTFIHSINQNYFSLSPDSHKSPWSSNQLSKGKKVTFYFILHEITGIEVRRSFKIVCFLTEIFYTHPFCFIFEDGFSYCNSFLQVEFNSHKYLDTLKDILSNTLLKVEMKLSIFRCVIAVVLYMQMKRGFFSSQNTTSLWCSLL